MAWIPRLPAAVALVLVGAAPLSAHAISVDCSDVTGACTVSNNGMDFMSCDCADGSGGGGAGGNEWAGLNEAELLLECEATLDLFCGPPLPPDGISCETPEGVCTVDNEPSDSFFCDCTDGGEPGGFGGNAWAGLSDEELYEVCLQTAYDNCDAGPGPTSADPTVADTGDPTDSGPGTSDTGDTDAVTTGDSGDSGDATAGDSGDATAGDSGDSGDATAGDSGSTSGGAEGSSGDTSASAGDASMSAGDASASAGDASASAGDGTTDEGPGEDIVESGCGCTSGSGPGGPLALAFGVLLGALGRRRRRH